MTFENSTYFKTLKHLKVEKTFGNFYLCENFFISELNEGVHFEWDMIQDVMVNIINFYGKDKKVGYISNRVNSYSMNPHFWNKVYDEYGLIVASAIVIYTDMMYMNASLEKLLSEKSIKRCNLLGDAIEWIMDLKELN